jgi:hypothetical protein
MSLVKALARLSTHPQEAIRAQALVILQRCPPVPQPRGSCLWSYPSPDTQALAILQPCPPSVQPCCSRPRRAPLLVRRAAWPCFDTGTCTHAMRVLLEGLTHTNK